MLHQLVLSVIRLNQMSIAPQINFSFHCMVQLNRPKSKRGLEQQRDPSLKCKKEPKKKKHGTSEPKIDSRGKIVRIKCRKFRVQIANHHPQG
jgi:hypothetical protein